MQLLLLFFYKEVFMKQLLIGFEGLDASFKQTNARSLYEYFYNKYRDKVDSGKLYLDLVSFPRYKKSSSVYVRKYLKKDFDKVIDYFVPNSLFATNPVYDVASLTSSFFMLDMLDWYTECYNKGVFEKDHIIIFDRYYYSMMYYLTPRLHEEINFSRIKSQKKIMKYEYDTVLNTPAFKLLPKLDAVIKLKTDSESIKDHLNYRKTNKDKYESDIAYLSKVNELFNKLDFTELLSDNNEYRIDAVQQIDVDIVGKSREEVFDDILYGSKSVLNRLSRMRWLK